MAKKKNKDKPAEDKHEKFKRVVTPRVKKAIKAITLIGNQAGSAYSYTPDDITIIIGTLRDAVLAVEKRFVSSGKQEIDFTLE